MSTYTMDYPRKTTVPIAFHDKLVFMGMKDASYGNDASARYSCKGHLEDGGLGICLWINDDGPRDEWEIGDTKYSIYVYATDKSITSDNEREILDALGAEMLKPLIGLQEIKYSELPQPQQYLLKALCVNSALVEECFKTPKGYQVLITLADTDNGARIHAQTMRICLKCEAFRFIEPDLNDNTVTIGF